MHQPQHLAPSFVLYSRSEALHVRQVAAGATVDADAGRHLHHIRPRQVAIRGDVLPQP